MLRNKELLFYKIHTYLKSKHCMLYMLLFYVESVFDNFGGDLVTCIAFFIYVVHCLPDGNS